jgi:hypothetical protein
MTAATAVVTATLVAQEIQLGATGKTVRVVPAVETIEGLEATVAGRKAVEPLRVRTAGTGAIGLETILQ